MWKMYFPHSKKGLIPMPKANLKIYRDQSQIHGMNEQTIADYARLVRLFTEYKEVLTDTGSYYLECNHSFKSIANTFGVTTRSIYNYMTDGPALEYLRRDGAITADMLKKVDNRLYYNRNKYKQKSKAV